MTSSTLHARAVATATAALGACLLASASPAAAFTPAAKAGGESTPLNLTTSTGSSAHSTSASGGASIVRTIVGLAIVIAVIWGLAWILKQVKAGRDPSVSNGGLASVAALTLSSGRTVHLVRAGNDFVLLGATEHGVAPIHRYSEEQAREAGLFVGGEEPEPEPVRSRLASVASQLAAGAGNAVAQGAYAARSDFPGAKGAIPSRTGRYGDDDLYAPRADQPAHSPVVGYRPDPMRAQPPPGGLIERLREMTVRR
jgi:flagellar protein FliO/FliZ